MVTVAAPRTGPCAPWATANDVSSIGRDVSCLDPDLLAINLTIASEILYRKSGSQYAGVCTETIRPCCRSSMIGPLWADSVPPWTPALVNGTWYNISGCGSPCVLWECGTLVPRIDLGQYPVTGATVKIDGVALASGFRINNWRWLERTDGELWPVTNDVLLADTQSGTFSVSIIYGQPPPQMMVSACAELAAELTKHCLGDNTCALPLRVTAISRQGVTYSVTNVMDVLDRGKTGLYFVDLAINTANPHNLDRPARVLSPDIHPSRR